jgi:2-polyprenyl-3-methyl-5-hydroxy-6-metoxy-1,4-benzoquinol methylase
METVACNLCHGSRASELYNLPDYLLQHPETRTRLVRCQECGLVYQNPRPTLEEMAQYYPNDYECYNPETDLGHNSWLLEQALQYGVRRRCRSVTRYKQGGRLLDVGCATGTFLRGMAPLPGWEVYGIDISPHASRIAREKYGLDVRTSDLEHADFPEAYFDAITLWEVLEHLHDPAASLQRIYRLLKPDGLLVLRVPNIESWDARLFGPCWAGLDSPRHLYVFSTRTLHQYLALSGFTILQTSTRSASYMSFLISLRFWLAGRGIKPQTIQKLSKVLYHPLMRAITVPLFFLVGLGLRGPHIVSVSQKKVG